MKRLQYFLIFTAMAWFSLVAPAEGEDMVECALAGDAARRQMKADLEESL